MTEIRGKEVLELSPETLFEQYGVHIIHQSLFGKYLKDGKPSLPKELQKMWASWRLHHPFALCVTWTDTDTRELISRFYPHYLDAYDSMRLPIQKCDFTRLTILHRYGGVYSDADFEAHMNIFPHLPSDADVMIVESPFFLNEALQNSLMVSRRPGIDLWEKCADNVVEGINWVNDPDVCTYQTEGCKFSKLFRNPLTSKITHLLYTQFLTGSNAIDKTIVRMLAKGDKLSYAPLTKEKWFSGPITTHHHGNGWISVPKAIPELIAIIAGALVVIILLIIVLTTVISSKRCRSWCAKVCDSSIENAY